MASVALYLPFSAPATLVAVPASAALVAFLVWAKAADSDLFPTTLTASALAGAVTFRTRSHGIYSLVVGIGC